MVKTHEKPIFIKEVKRDMYQMVINGKPADAKSGEMMTVYNPATGKPIAEVPKADREDVLIMIGLLPSLGIFSLVFSNKFV